MSGLIAIGGPTGSGKSSLAMLLAASLGGEIVSCDSMQIYRGLDIGTAKPSEEDRREVRHWLIDIRDPWERYSVADYVLDARSAIEDINSRGKTAILCGGTGLYMTSLLSGTAFPSSAPASGELRAELSARIDKEGPEGLLREVAAADPEYAAKLSPNDRKRIIRAVEVIRSGSSPTEAAEASDSPGYPGALRLMVNCSDRQALYARIGRRCDAMMEAGILDEARYVYENRDRFATASAAIGYKEFFPHFSAGAPAEECLEALKKATRNYAKRQLTWFRRERFGAVFFSDLEGPEEMARKAEELCKGDSAYEGIFRH